MSVFKWTDAEREAAVRELAAWGVRSHHGEWTDSETQARAASDVLAALAPFMAERLDALRARLAKVEALADEWEHTLSVAQWRQQAAKRLRAALADPQEATDEDRA